jgi:hypothetical protein
MTSASAVVRPDVPVWAAVWKRKISRRRQLFSWLTGLSGTVGAFIADRGWEAMDDPAWTGGYSFIDMIGGASILLAVAFAVFGWMLGRLSVAAAPLVLAFAAVPHTLDGYASAPLWWAATAVGSALALAAAWKSRHELHLIHSLAKSSLSGRSVAVGPVAAQARQRALRRGMVAALVLPLAAVVAWAAAFAVLPAELGRTYAELGEESSSTMFATAAAALSVTGIAVVIRQMWRIYATHRVGTRLVWEIPLNAGLASQWPFVMRESGLAPGEALSLGECVCLAEFRRAFPDTDGDLPEDESIYASEYCPLHGIDRINGLSVSDFGALAGESWLWDSESGLPERVGPDNRRLLLYGFAGHAFTGIPLKARADSIDAPFPEIGQARETQPGKVVPDWDKSERPGVGVLDMIDLQPAGYNGTAYRYRHGRAWFEEADTAEPVTGRQGSEEL